MLCSLLLSAVRTPSAIIGVSFFYWTKWHEIHEGKVKFAEGKVSRCHQRGPLLRVQPAAHKHCLSGKGTINLFPSDLKSLGRKKLPNPSLPQVLLGSLSPVIGERDRLQRDNQSPFISFCHSLVCVPVNTAKPLMLAS